MILRARVQGGQVVVDGPLNLAEGAELELRTPLSAEEIAKSREKLLKYSGIVKDLPANASTTVDQVLYGRPTP